MKLLRQSFDAFYDLIKHPVFWTTKKDPEVAHNLFTWFCRTLHKTGLENILLADSKSQSNNVQISNAAGFNKNAEIPPSVLKAFGFDRVVIGTVTYDSWDGNPRPRIVRFPKTNSMVNWMGLPGVGAKEVRANLKQNLNYRTDVPVTLNLMATPGKVGEEVLDDLYKTVFYFKDVYDVDRFELNISCPNTSHSRESYQRQLDSMLGVIEKSRRSGQEIYEKVSPDLEESDVDKILEVSADHDVIGFTTTNTTTNHNQEFIPEIPGKGGASGDAVYEASLRVQKLFADRTNHRLIACGGISSPERMKERLENGASEIQIYTPFIFSGPRLLRKLRT